MTMKSPGWAGMVSLDARLFGIGVRPGDDAARRARVIPGLDTAGDEPRGVALFAVALTGALFAVAFAAVLFAVAVAAVLFAVAFAGVLFAVALTGVLFAVALTGA